MVGFSPDFQAALEAQGIDLSAHPVEGASRPLGLQQTEQGRDVFRTALADAEVGAAILRSRLDPDCDLYRPDGHTFITRELRVSPYGPAWTLSKAVGGMGAGISHVDYSYGPENGLALSTNGRVVAYGVRQVGRMGASHNVISRTLDPQIKVTELGALGIRGLSESTKPFQLLASNITNGLVELLKKTKH